MAAQQAWSGCPPVQMVYLAEFNQHEGTQIRWNRTRAGVVFDHSTKFAQQVEERSVPPRIHNRDADLIRFTVEHPFGEADPDHPGFTGLVAYRSVDASASDRGRRFFFVGVLFRTSDVDTVWLQGKPLEDLAGLISKRPDDLGPLGAFADTHLALSDLLDMSEVTYVDGQGDGGRGDDPVSCLIPGRDPIPGLFDFFKLFGPLAFLLHRLAAQRRPILIVGEPAIEKLCEWVHVMSLISGLPPVVVASAPRNVKLDSRLRARYSVVITDVDELMESRGWVACTSDPMAGEIASKFAVVVNLPSELQKSVWPIVKMDGITIGATQRDLSRFKALYTRLEVVEKTLLAQPGSEVKPGRGVMFGISWLYGLAPSEPSIFSAATATLEPIPWPALALRSFLWWAAAGEPDPALRDAEQEDRSVLSAIPDAVRPPFSRPEGDEGESAIPPTMREKQANADARVVESFETFGGMLYTNCPAGYVAQSRGGGGDISRTATGMSTGTSSSSEQADPGVRQRVAATTRESDESAPLLQVDSVRVDSDGGEAVEQVKMVYVSWSQMTRMGLDPWSQLDGQFVKQFISQQCVSPPTVQVTGWELCGVKVV